MILYIFPKNLEALYQNKIFLTWYVLWKLLSRGHYLPHSLWRITHGGIKAFKYLWSNFYVKTSCLPNYIFRYYRYFSFAWRKVCIQGWVDDERYKKKVGNCGTIWTECICKDITHSYWEAIKTENRVKSWKTQAGGRIFINTK